MFGGVIIKADKGIRSFGQHYLKDENILNILIDSAHLNKNDKVIEIGAGEGVLTEQIAKKAGWVISFEIDNKTENSLENLSKKYSNLHIIFCNVLEFDLVNIEFNKIVSSLPYQITEPFIEKIKDLKFEKAILLVGKTFGKKICDDSFENKLAILTNTYFCTSYIMDVDKSSFNPPPKTVSSVIELVPRKKDAHEDPKYYLMRELFEQRDKIIKNALREAIIRYFAEYGVTVTKKESQAIIRKFVGDLDLSKGIEQSSNKTIELLFKSICSICEEYCCNSYNNEELCNMKDNIRLLAKN